MGLQRASTQRRPRALRQKSWGNLVTSKACNSVVPLRPRGEDAQAMAPTVPMISIDESVGQSVAAYAEADRLFALQSTRLLHSAESEDFDRITRLAAQFFDVPTVLVSLVSADAQWFKSRIGMEAEQTERNVAFCHFAIQNSSVMVVEDATLDDRFKSNRLVTGELGIRFYAGAPLITSKGHALGSLCVIDYVPRKFSPLQCRQLQDMAQLVMAQIELFQASVRMHDVTRLPNRAQWALDLNALAALGDTGPHTLVLVDVMSHNSVQNALLAVGIRSVEITLRLVAARLQEILAGRSPLYHVSDTRFAFVLRGSDAAAQEAVIGQILLDLHRPIQAGSHFVELEIECGAVVFDSSAKDTSDVLRKATSAMYQAERAQLPFMMYNASFDHLHKRIYEMLRAVPAALIDGEFRLVYQPKLDVALGRFTAVEALIRWRSPKWGVVSPGEFIPATENTSAIHLLTEWVLHAALAQTALWQTQGLYTTVAVNVSARNLEHPQFVQTVRNACRLHGVDPRHLDIECTENAVLTGDRTLDVLRQLRDLGCQISLDDFGIGYSNLACLQTLPVGLLKIDQSLVNTITEDYRAWTLLQSLISLGHTLGYRMLAEGVENAEVFSLLADAGCDAMQGYFLSKPIESVEVLSFMRNQRQVLLALPRRDTASGFSPLV